MATNFQQTATTISGAMPIPDGGLTENGTSLYNTMEIGGNTSHIESEVTLPPSSSRSCVAFMSPLTQPGNGSVWTAGTFIVRLHVHAGSKWVEWSHVWICRANFQAKIVEIIGSNLTIGLLLRTVTHTTFDLDVSVSASPNALSSDRLYIIYAFRNFHRSAGKTIMVSPYAANTTHWTLEDADIFIGPNTRVKAVCTLVAPILQISRTFIVFPVNTECSLVAPAILNPRTIVASAAVNASATVIAPTIIADDHVLNPLPVTASCTLIAPTIKKDITVTAGVATASCTLLAATVFGGAGVLKMRFGGNWVVIGGES